MTALTEFVAFCLTIFIELVNITLDLLAFPFLIGAIVAPWRSPFFIYGLMYKKRMREHFFKTRGDYRLFSVLQFILAIVEGVTFFIMPIVALSILRTAKFFEKVGEKYKNYDDEWNFNGDLVAAVWQQLGKLLRDLVPFFFLVGALLMPWRWPYLLLGLKRHGAGWLFQTIVPCTTPKKDRTGEDEILGRWIGQFFIGFVDLITAFPLILVLCTGLRTRKLLKKLASSEMRAKYETEVEWNYEARVYVWKMFFALLVDLIFVPLAMFVVLTGWRVLELRAVTRDKSLKGMKKRCKAIEVFFATVIDVPFIVMGAFIVIFAPWRVRTLWASLKLWERKGPEGDDRRESVCGQFVEALKDMGHIPLAAAVLSTPWRGIYLWRALRIGQKGTPAVPLPNSETRRKRIREDFGETMKDHPCVLMAAIVLVFCPWRARLLWKDAKPWPGATIVRDPEFTAAYIMRKPNWNPAAVVLDADDRRTAAVEQFLSFLIDIPVIAMAAVVFVTLWRAPLLWRALKFGNPPRPYDACWNATAEQFFSLLRDVPFLFLLPATLYRLPNVCFQIAASRQQLLPLVAPLIRVTAATTAHDDKDRFRLRVAGTKDSNFTTAQVKVTVGGDDFWGSVEKGFGSTAATVGKSMLPAKTMPKYLKAPALDKPGETSVCLSFTVGGAKKALHKLQANGDAPLAIQGQVGSGKALEVLFELVARPSELLNGARAPDAREGPPSRRGHRTPAQMAEDLRRDLGLTGDDTSVAFQALEALGMAGGAHDTTETMLAKCHARMLGEPNVPNARGTESVGAAPATSSAPMPAAATAAPAAGGGRSRSAHPVAATPTAELHASPASSAPASADADAASDTDAGNHNLMMIDARQVGRPVELSEVELPEVGVMPAPPEAAAASSNGAFDEEVDDPNVFGPATARALSIDLERPAMGEVAPVQDVVWAAVAMELAQLLLDIIRVIATICLLLAPWRFVQLLKCTFEPVKRWPLRQVDMLDAFARDECAHADANIDAWYAQLCTSARGDEHAFPVPPRKIDAPWRGPPLPACTLYVGLASASASDHLVNKLKKLDAPLAELYSKLFTCQRQRRMCVVNEAEMLRSVLFPAHWSELLLMLRRKHQALKPPAARGLSRSPPDPASPSLEVSAPALLRTIDALRNAIEHELVDLHRKIDDARAERRKATGACKLSCGALCKRSSTKARQQVALLCKGALFDWLAVVGIGLLLCTLYRASSLLSSLHGARCWRSVHTRVALQLKQVPFDILMLLQLVVLTLAFWQALETWLEFSDLLIARRDVPAARRALSRRVSSVIEEMGEWLQVLLSPLILWDTYKFVLATLCFGMLVPVHLIGKLLALAPRLCCRGVSADREPRSCHFWLGGVLWAALVAFPFYLVYVLAPSTMVPLPVDGFTPAHPPMPPAWPPTPPIAPPLPPSMPPTLSPLAQPEDLSTFGTSGFDYLWSPGMAGSKGLAIAWIIFASVAAGMCLCGLFWSCQEEEEDKVSFFQMVGVGGGFLPFLVCIIVWRVNMGPVYETSPSPPLPPPFVPGMHPPLGPPPSEVANYSLPNLPPMSPPPPPPPLHVLTERGAVLLPALIGAYLGTVMLLGVLSSSVALSTSELLRIAAPRRVLRWTASNGFAIFQVLLDMAQLTALPFLALHAAGGLERYAEMGLVRSSGIFYVLRRAADAVTLWTQMTDGMTTALIFTAFGALVLWYLLFSLPIVIDELLKWESSHGKVQHSKLWSLIMHPLHSTLHVTVLMQLIKPLGCTYSTYAPSALYSDPTIRCWDPYDPLQSRMALCALLGIAFYLLTVHVVSSDPSLLRQAQQSPTLDIKYSELYVLVSNALRAAMAVCYLMLHDEPLVLLPVLLGTSLVLVAWTLGFHKLFRAPACAIRGVVELRAVGDALAAWAAVCCLVDVLTASPLEPSVPTVSLGDLSVYLPELMCLVGWGAIIMLGFICHTCRRVCASQVRRDEVRALRECAQLATDVEQYWQQQGGVMSSLWVKRAARWRRTARSVRDVSTLSSAIAELEQHVRAGVQVAEFMQERRPAWQRDLAATPVTVTKLTTLVSELRDSVVVVGRTLDSDNGDSAADAAARTMLKKIFPPPPNFDKSASPYLCNNNTLKLKYDHLLCYLYQFSQDAHRYASTATMATVVVIPPANGLSVGIDPPSNASTSRASAPATSQTEASTTNALEQAPAAVRYLSELTGSSGRVSGRDVTVITVDPPVVAAVVVEPAQTMDQVFKDLRAQMLDAKTNFERVEVVEAFAKKGHSSVSLTCMELATLAETMTLRTRKKDVLVSLHKYLSDRHNFHALVEEQLTLLFDREDVLRDVARAERKRYLEDLDG